MKKSILIISSDYTGHGHKSITDSLKEQFRKHAGVEVHVVDGFALGGNVGLKIGKLYGSVTRNAKELWKIFWDIAIRTPVLMNEFMEISVRDSFLKLIQEVKPDLIICVHANFNGSLLNIMKKNKLNIPFVVLIADLVTITPLWADPRADYTICPTIESKYKCLEFGVPESKLRVIGFPSREKFCDHLLKKQDKPIKHDLFEKDFTEIPINCLIMSGGEGVGNMRRVAEILLKNFNCRVKIIAGRNKMLKTRLELTLKEKYNDRVEIFGFVENVQDFMLESDITFVRGSPNVMMEAVLCNTPMVITGALPGQEEGNPGYAEKYNLGVVCKELKNLKKVVSGLLTDNAKMLKQIRESQRNFRNPDIAGEIVNFLLNIEKGETVVSHLPRKKFRRIDSIRSFVQKAGKH
ncbi:MAG: glycosyltransferase [Clostridia bacterium]|nr:glycosyltransferase [Clostridia bacterium]